MDEEQESYKYAFTELKSTQIGWALGSLRKLYCQEGEPEYLVVPYVLTCCTYLEARLNDSFQGVEKEIGSALAVVYQGASLVNKLKIIVPVLTENRFEINTEHWVYQRLRTLISTRNKIAHAKSEMVELDIPQDASKEELFGIFGPGPLLREQMDKKSKGITLGASDHYTPLEYHNAIDKLERWFFRRCPDKLSQVEMVIAKNKNIDWETVTSTMVKKID